VVSFTPLPLYPRRKLGGHQSRLDHLEKRTILDPTVRLELRPLSRRARSQSLYRLRYSGSSHITVHLLFLDGTTRYVQ
jgi:hypothetical protein